MWRCIYTPQFLKDLNRLPKRERGRISEIAFGDAIKVDPLMGGKAEKLRGYSQYYRFRVGDYRVGWRLDFELNQIKFLRVRHRKDFYRYFP